MNRQTVAVVASLATFILFIGPSCADDSAKPENTQEAIDRICGVNPVLGYIEKYKSAVMDSEMQTKLKECLIGDLQAEILDWNIADGALQGCLINKYGFQELDPYVEKISKGYDEARINTKGIMDEYIVCNNSIRKNMREYGEAKCPNDTAEEEKSNQ